MTYYMNPCRCWKHRLRFWIEARYFWHVRRGCPTHPYTFDTFDALRDHLNVRNGPNR